MKSELLHVGLDVDDNFYHGAGLCLQTGEIIEFKTKPTFGALLQKLEKIKEKGFVLKVCYEASYIGYNLCRDLNKKNIDCEIIAPSLVPEASGKRIKTDRLDSLKLAEYYGKGLLTTIYIPTEEDEQVRDLIRTRSFLVEQRKRLKIHILSTCRRYRLDYKQSNKSKKYWTIAHLDWLTINVNKLSDTIKMIFEGLLYQLDKLNSSIKEYDEMISLISEQDKYKEKKDTLNCFRGLDTLTSMTLITELGDIRRFNHPKKLSSWAGLDICEYSSGDKERKYGITKMGNKQVRKVVVEACQNVSSYTISRRLKKAREGQSESIIAIAEKCRSRLRKKAIRMQIAGKHTNKIKVACGREFLGFIWEALHQVSK